MSKETKSGGVHPLLKLAFGAGGIYISFLSMGVYHSQIFKYEDTSGQKFKHVFFLQALGKFVAHNLFASCKDTLS